MKWFLAFPENTPGERCWGWVTAEMITVFITQSSHFSPCLKFSIKKQKLKTGYQDVSLRLSLNFFSIISHFLRWNKALKTGFDSTIQLCVCAVCGQSCPTLCDPVDYSPPGFSVYGIVQASILEWVAISFSRGSSQPRDQTLVICISCTGREILYHCTFWEATLYLFLMELQKEIPSISSHF